MRILQLEKPVIGKQTGIGQAFQESVVATPILKWENEQKLKRIKIK